MFSSLSGPFGPTFGAPNTAGALPILETAPNIGLWSLSKINNINTTGAVLEINSGDYFQDPVRETLSVSSVTRTTVAPYSRAWIVTLNTAFSTILRNGVFFGEATRQLHCGIYAVSADKKTLTLVSDNWSPTPNPLNAWVFTNLRVNTTVSSASTTTITLAPATGNAIYVGDTVDVVGYSSTYVTAWDSNTRTGTVSPAFPTAPSAGTAVTVIAEPRTIDGKLHSPPILKTWQWYRDNVAIPGETLAQYTTVAADIGKTITAKEYAYYWDKTVGITTTTSNSATPTGAAPTGLLTKQSLSYLGAFRAPTGADWSGSDGLGPGRGVWFKPEGNGGAGTIILPQRDVGTNQGLLTEFSIPATLDITGNPANMSQGTFILPSPYAFNIADGIVIGGKIAQQTIAPSDTNGIVSCGVFTYNGNLYQNFKAFYQEGNVGTYFKRTGLSANAGTATGPFAFATGTIGGSAISLGWYAGGVCSIPATWQASLGGPMLQSNWMMSNPEPQGNGPFMAVFDPDTIGSTPAANTILVGYTNIYPLAADISCVPTAWQRQTSIATSLVFPSNSSSVLVIGSHGFSGKQYGQDFHLDYSGCDSFIYDLTYPNKGWHAYPYQNAVWAYDANDLLAVKNGSKQPYQIKPYSVWSMNYPGQDINANFAAPTWCIDSASNKIYFVERETSRTSAYGPIIHVYQITV